MAGEAPISGAGNEYVVSYSVIADTVAATENINKFATALERLQKGSKVIGKLNSGFMRLERTMERWSGAKVQANLSQMNTQLEKLAANLAKVGAQMGVLGPRRLGGAAGVTTAAPINESRTKKTSAGGVTTTAPIREAKTRKLNPNEARRLFNSPAAFTGAVRDQLRSMLTGAAGGRATGNVNLQGNAAGITMAGLKAIQELQAGATITLNATVGASFKAAVDEAMGLVNGLKGAASSVVINGRTAGGAAATTRTAGSSSQYPAGGVMAGKATWNDNGKYTYRTPGATTMFLPALPPAPPKPASSSTSSSVSPKAPRIPGLRPPEIPAIPGYGRSPEMTDYLKSVASGRWPHETASMYSRRLQKSRLNAVRGELEYRKAGINSNNPAVRQGVNLFPMLPTTALAFAHAGLPLPVNTPGWIKDLARANEIARNYRPAPRLTGYEDKQVVKGLFAPWDGRFVNPATGLIESPKEIAARNASKTNLAIKQAQWDMQKRLKEREKIVKRMPAWARTLTVDWRALPYYSEVHATAPGAIRPANMALAQTGITPNFGRPAGARIQLVPPPPAASSGRRGKPSATPGSTTLLQPLQNGAITTRRPGVMSLPAPPPAIPGLGYSAAMTDYINTASQNPVVANMSRKMIRDMAARRMSDAFIQELKHRQRALKDMGIATPIPTHALADARAGIPLPMTVPQWVRDVAAQPPSPVSSPMAKRILSPYDGSTLAMANGTVMSAAMMAPGAFDKRWQELINRKQVAWQAQERSKKALQQNIDRQQREEARRQAKEAAKAEREARRTEREAQRAAAKPAKQTWYDQKGRLRRSSASPYMMRPGNLNYRLFGPTPLPNNGGMAVGMLQGMGIMYGLSGIGSLFKGLMDQSVDYDNSMMTVRNILQSHDRSSEFGSQFAKMEGRVREIGMATKYTVTEVADAAKFLAMAGLGVQDISTAMKPISDIALVGDLDLGQTADMVTNIMTAYEKKAPQMGQVADIMTNTFTMSNVTLDELADAFRYSASLLSAGKISFEESSAALGVLGDAGIKGTQAGTSMRTILNNIINPRGKYRKKAWADTGVQRFDEQGNVRSLYAIFKDLAELDLPVEKFYQLFDKTASQAAVALTKHVDKWNDVIRENFLSAGLADELAEKKKNTIKGLWAQLTSVLVDDGVTSFSKLDGFIRSTLRGGIDWLSSDSGKSAVSSMIDNIKEMGEAVMDVTKLFYGFYSKMSPVFTMLIKYGLYLWPLTKLFSLGSNLVNVAKWGNNFRRMGAHGLNDARQYAMTAIGRGQHLGKNEAFTVSQSGKRRIATAMNGNIAVERKSNYLGGSYFTRIPKKVEGLQVLRRRNRVVAPEVYARWMRSAGYADAFNHVRAINPNGTMQFYRSTGKTISDETLARWQRLTKQSGKLPAGYVRAMTPDGGVVIAQTTGKAVSKEVIERAQRMDYARRQALHPDGKVPVLNNYTQRIDANGNMSVVGTPNTFATSRNWRKKGVDRTIQGRTVSPEVYERWQRRYGRYGLFPNSMLRNGAAAVGGTVGSMGGMLGVGYGIGELTSGETNWDKWSGGLAAGGGLAAMVATGPVGWGIAIISGLAAVGAHYMGVREKAEMATEAHKKFIDSFKSLDNGMVEGTDVAAIDKVYNILYDKIDTAANKQQRLVDLLREQKELQETPETRDVQYVLDYYNTMKDGGNFAAITDHIAGTAGFRKSKIPGVTFQVPQEYGGGQLIVNDLKRVAAIDALLNQGFKWGDEDYVGFTAQVQEMLSSDNLGELYNNLVNNKIEGYQSRIYNAPDGTRPWDFDAFDPKNLENWIKNSDAKSITETGMAQHGAYSKFSERLDKLRGPMNAYMEKLRKGQVTFADIANIQAYLNPRDSDFSRQLTFASTLTTGEDGKTDLTPFMLRQFGAHDGFMKGHGTPSETAQDFLHFYYNTERMLQSFPKNVQESIRADVWEPLTYWKEIAQKIVGGKLKMGDVKDWKEAPDFLASHKEVKVKGGKKINLKRPLVEFSKDTLGAPVDSIAPVPVPTDSIISAPAVPDTIAGVDSMKAAVDSVAPKLPAGMMDYAGNLLRGMHETNQEYLGSMTVEYIRAMQEVKQITDGMVTDSVVARNTLDKAFEIWGSVNTDSLDNIASVPNTMYRKAGINRTRKTEISRTLNLGQTFEAMGLATPGTFAGNAFDNLRTNGSIWSSVPPLMNQEGLEIKPQVMATNYRPQNTINIQPGAITVTIETSSDRESVESLAGIIQNTLVDSIGKAADTLFGSPNTNFNI